MPKPGNSTRHQQGAHALNTALILNPTASGGRAAELQHAIVARLNGLGIEVDCQRSKQAGDIGRLCREAIESGATRLLVAGGDGTLFEAVNAIMQTDHNVVLAPVPIGTGNDFAKMLGLGDSWESAIDQVLADTTRRVDVGHLQTEHAGYYFLNGLGIGFDAEVAMAATGTKRLPAKLAYYLALLEAWLAGIRPHRLSVDCDAGHYRNAITLCEVANGRYVGGSFQVAPTAVIDDGKLDIVIADHLSRLGLIRLLLTLLRARHLDHSAVTHWQLDQVCINGDAALPIQVDGELVEPARYLRVKLFPRVLEVLVHSGAMATRASE